MRISCTGLRTMPARFYLQRVETALELDEGNEQYEFVHHLSSSNSSSSNSSNSHNSGLICPGFGARTRIFFCLFWTELSPYTMVTPHFVFPSTRPKLKTLHLGQPRHDLKMMSPQEAQQRYQKCVGLFLFFFIGVGGLGAFSASFRSQHNSGLCSIPKGNSNFDWDISQKQLHP